MVHLLSKDLEFNPRSALGLKLLMYFFCILFDASVKWVKLQLMIQIIVATKIIIKAILC